MRAEITTLCRSEGSRYTRLNLLGWAMLCPHAMELLWHGSTPLIQPSYPTGDESKGLHDEFKRIVDEALRSTSIRGVKIIDGMREYWHEIGFRRDDMVLCARSKADLVYMASVSGKLMNIYVEVSSTRINIAKPWQALLRGIALYYEWRLPVGVVIVAPDKIMYKLVENADQDEILRRLKRTSNGYNPNPNLCSLCELANYCPHRVI